MEIPNFKTVYAWPFKKKIIVYVVVFVLAFYLGTFFTLSSLKTRLADAQREETDLKNQFLASATREATLRSQVNQLPRILSMFSEWQKQIISESKLPELLNNILSIGSNNHLYFSLFNPTETVKEGNYIKTPIKVVAVGSYHQISDFMSQVANMPWIVVVGDFTLSKENKSDLLGDILAKQASAQNLLTLELMLIVYQLPSTGDKNGTSN